MWVACLLSFPGNEAHELLSGGPGLGVLGVGAKEFMLKKFIALFLSPSRAKQAQNKKRKIQLF